MDMPFHRETNEPLPSPMRVHPPRHFRKVRDIFGFDSRPKSLECTKKGKVGLHFVDLDERDGECFRPDGETSLWHIDMRRRGGGAGRGRYVGCKVHCDERDEVEGE